MWCAVGVGVGWCRSSLSRLPMLRREGKQRGRRCRVLFSDLKALLLRPPPPPAPSAMNGAPSAHGASPTERTRDEVLPDAAAAAAAEWAGEAEQSATESPDGGSSSEDCTKEKLDERASLESCTESGARTPLCRICFQGADQGLEKRGGAIPKPGSDAAAQDALNGPSVEGGQDGRNVPTVKFYNEDKILDLMEYKNPKLQLRLWAVFQFILKVFNGVESRLLSSSTPSFSNNVFMELCGLCAGALSCWNVFGPGELLSPCRCSGSVRCTHEPCLIKWISERGSWSCELCYYKYQVIAISTKNPLQWQAISLTVIEKVQIAAAVLGSLFLIASISWLVWSSLSPSAKWQRQDLLFQICYAMYGFMDLVCIALIVHEGPSVFRIFHRWQAVNQQWKVLNYDKLKDSEDPQKGSSTLRSLTLPLGNRAVVAPPTSPSPSSSALTSAATVTITPGTTVPAVTAAPEDSSEAERHCAYSLLQLLSLNLRNQEPRNATTTQPRNDNRELVMRVTTV
ncbi:hypothetical protein QTP86_020116 [Hemibagrus guttatus]|nr:hypothetical protein QTP86_020116 [Hemibagrus guttatus]